VSEIVIVIDMVLREMIVHSEVIIVEVVAAVVEEADEGEEVVVIILVVEDEVDIKITHVNPINHALVLITISHPGKIAEKEDVVVEEVVSMIVNVI
jgi:hypothetical protein